MADNIILECNVLMWLNCLELLRRLKKITVANSLYCCKLYFLFKTINGKDFKNQMRNKKKSHSQRVVLNIDPCISLIFLNFISKTFFDLRIKSLIVNMKYRKKMFENYLKKSRYMREFNLTSKLP